VAAERVTQAQRQADGAGTSSTVGEVMRRGRKAMLIPASFSLVLNLLALTVPLYMMQVFDRVLSSRSHETLFFLTLIGIGALVVLACLDGLRSRVLARIGVWVDRSMSPEAFARALEAQVQGRVYRMEALRDIAQIRGFLSGATLFALFDAPWVPIFLFVIFLLHPWLGLLAFVGALVLFGLALVNEYSTRGKLKEAGGRQIRNMRSAEDALRNAEVLDAMGMLGPILRRWYDDSDEVIRDQQIASDRSGMILAFSKFIRLALQMAILGMGAYLVLDQRLSPGGMIAGSIILSRALQPVEQSIGTWRQLIGAREAYHRLVRFFEQEWLPRQSISLPPPEGRLESDRVVYVFPGGERPVLKGVSFALEPGGSVAVIGPSAAGKTTLARILVGVIRPSSGAVRLDGADVFAWKREDFGQHVGYLPQDVELFTGSVLRNIGRLGDPDPDDVVKAAQLAGCHEMILGLPRGYDTEIGEGGSQLSGGQRQRIALARAVFGEPRLLVLDEPNASLDDLGEQSLIRALLQMKERGATVVMIAHRTRMVRTMDHVLILRDGAVDRFGPREEVLASLANRTQGNVAQFPRAVRSTPE